MSSNQIQNKLFQKYYSKNEYSKVTSSHWQDFGAKTKVTQSESGFKFNAYGISTYGRHQPLDLLNIYLLIFYFQECFQNTALKKKRFMRQKPLPRISIFILILTTPNMF